jgi:hypothetical protein
VSLGANGNPPNFKSRYTGNLPLIGSRRSRVERGGAKTRGALHQLLEFAGANRHGSGITPLDGMVAQLGAQLESDSSD